jgi:hypothetical protein
MSDASVFPSASGVNPVSQFLPFVWAATFFILLGSPSGWCGLADLYSNIDGHEYGYLGLHSRHLSKEMTKEAAAVQVSKRICMDLE